MRTRFVAGRAGSLRFVPPEAATFGPPASAAVTIRQSNGLELPTPVTDAAATVDATALLLSADAAAGATQFEVASVVGLVAGRLYVLTAADGERTAVEVAGAGGTTVFLADPLPRAFATASTLAGVELSLALAAPQLVSPVTRGGYLYRAAWAYVIGGVTYQADQMFEVRARVLVTTLVEAEVMRYLPARLDALMEGGPRALRAVMGEAWDDVLDDAAARGFEPDKIMDSDRLRRPHRVKTLAVLAAAWGPDWREWATAKAEEYGRALDAALNAGDWYDSREDTVQAKGETKFPSVILTR